MTPNYRPVLYTARVHRLRSARWEFALTVVISLLAALLVLGILGYMDIADERAESAAAAEYRLKLQNVPAPGLAVDQGAP